MLLINLLLVGPTVGIIVAMFLLIAGADTMVSSPETAILTVATLSCSIAAFVGLGQLLERARTDPYFNPLAWDHIALPLMLSVACVAFVCLLIATVAPSVAPGLPEPPD